MDTGLFFKQKDFESDYSKRRLAARPITIGHPLKRGKRQKSPKKEVTISELKSSNPLAKLIPGNRSTVTLPTQQPPPATMSMVQLKPPEPPKEQGKKLVFSQKGPWAAIRGEFIKVYDTRKERVDIYVANPFGSAGLRREEEMREKYDVRLKDAEVKNESVSKQISIKTYLAILEDMRKDMKRKWDDQDKVGTLQIAIQATKLLHDTEKAKFHALKFAYVIDIVEQFGIYVYERIKSLSFPSFSQQRLKQTTLYQLEGSNIAEAAQEICRNWLLKIGSIRELMPRAIIETTLLRLYFFLDGGKKVKQVLNRLAKTNRGFGQYINSIFFSTFLVRIGHECLPKQKGFILDILDDVFFYIKQGKTKFSRQDISYDEFFDILDPFFKSAFESLGESLDESDFRRFTRSLPPNPHPVILKNLVNSFSDELLATCCVELTKMLQKIMGENKYPLYKTMLTRLSAVRFPQSRELIMLTWTDLMEINDIKTFLELLAPFVEIIFKNLEKVAKGQFFSLILEKFNSLFSNFGNPKQKQFFVKFEQFLTTLLQNTENASEILTIEPFLQIISYFPKTVKIHICNKIVTKFLEREQSLIHDPMVVNTILTLIKNLQGQPEIDKLVLIFVKKVDFRNDLEGMLNFYGQIRAIFGYLPVVTIDLIHKTVGLTLKARKIAKARSTKKLTAFMQACIAYCYITTPLIESSLARIKLYLYVSEVALAMNLISQSSSLLKMSISQLLELEANNDEEVSKILKQIVGFMFVMPDDPESEFLFMYNGLCNAFEMIKFKPSLATAYKLRFYADCLCYLNAQVQERLPFHIQGVNSNDFLYKTKDFRKAVLEKLLELFVKMEQVVKEALNAPAQDYEADRLLYSSVLECMGTVVNTLQSTPRCEAFMGNLITILKNCTDRLNRDKPSRTFMSSKAAWIESLKKKLEEDEYQSINLTLPKVLA